MRVELLFPKEYLCAADFVVHGEQTWTIDRVYQDELQTRDGKNEIKALIQFAEARKKLVLNKTNAMAIAEAHGLETDDWVGKQIELYPARVLAFGKEVDAIRVRAPSTAVRMHQVHKPMTGRSGEATEVGQARKEVVESRAKAAVRDAISAPETTRRHLDRFQHLSRKIQLAKTQGRIDDEAAQQLSSDLVLAARNNNPVAMDQVAIALEDVA